MKQFDWDTPQRQPWAGLGIVFLNTFWEVVKRFWPFLLIMLLGKGEGRVNRYEILALSVLGFTIISAVFRFLFFRFYIEEGNLVIKKGWLKKETKVIPLQKIQTVNIEQGPLHQLLNIVKITIDTAGSQKAEATIDALHRSMALSLREQLLTQTTIVQETAEEPKKEEPLVRLGLNDLFRLSLSANHLETFFIMLAFAIGFYDNLKNIDAGFVEGAESYIPRGTLNSLLALVVIVLLFTMLVSAIRIFFRFYNFTVFRNRNGFYIRSGLTNVRERLVGLRRIQYLTWKANWIRKLMNLWMMEFHVALSNESKLKEKVQIPLTQKAFIPVLANEYHTIPDTSGATAIRIHPSYVTRRTVLAGLLPALILLAALWSSWQQYTLFILLYPVAVWVVTYCTWKKFRLWAFADIAYLKRGIFGESWTMVNWNKLQSAEIRQSIFQRRKGLASFILHTASGNITCHFIQLEAARQLMNYALFRTESIVADPVHTGMAMNEERIEAGEDAGA